MKLSSNIWLLGVLAVGFAACSDDEYTGEPQVTPQPDVLPADAVSGTDVYAPGSLFDVNAEKTDLAKMMPVLNISRLDAQPAGYDLQVSMLVAKSEADLSNPAARIDTVLTELPAQSGALRSLGLSAEAFNVLFHRLYGPNDAAQPLAVRFDAYSVKDQTSALLGTVGTTGTVSFKPVQYAYSPENSYWIVNADDPSVRYEMKNSGASVWNDPKFSAVFDVDLEGINWKVVPGSMVANPVAAQCFGPEVAEDTEGSLVLGGQPGTINVVQKEPYMISINITNPNDNYTELRPTYDIKLAYEVVYILGNAQGGDAAPAVLTTKDYVNYGGFVAFSGWGCKMTDKPSWGGAEWANFAFTVSEDGKSYTGTVGSGSSSGNIEGLPDGIYAWVFNILSGEVTATPIKQFELIGTATGGWGDADVQVLQPATDAADCATFSADINFTSTGEFKLRGQADPAAPNWAFSLGGELDNLIWDGPNTNFTGAVGTHKVTISFNVAKEGAFADAPRLHYVIE